MSKKNTVYMSTIDRAFGHCPASFYGYRHLRVGRKRVVVRRMKPFDCFEKPVYVASVFNPDRNILFGGYGENPIGSVIAALTVAGFSIKR